RQKHKTSSFYSAGHEAQIELMKRPKERETETETEVEKRDEMSPEEQHMKAEACWCGGSPSQSLTAAGNCC
ncbi:hypothetical protein ABG768_003136, partial [Culter alburnus]